MEVTHFETFMNGWEERFTFNRGDNMTRRIQIANSYRTTMSLNFSDNADVEVTLKSDPKKSTIAFLANILWVNVGAIAVPDLKAFIVDKMKEGPGQYQGIIVSSSGSHERFATALNYIHYDLQGGPCTIIKTIGMDHGWCLVGHNEGMTILGPRDKSSPKKVELIMY